MPQGDSDFDKAREWCAKARELLGILKGRKHGNRMDTALAKIKGDLDIAEVEIKKLDPGEKKDRWQREYEKARAEFLQISKLAQKAAETKVNEMAQIASEQLVVLQHRISITFRGTTNESEEGLREAQELMDRHAIRYEGRYKEMLAVAEKQRKELFALNRPKLGDAYDKPVADRIAAAKKLADEKRYSEAIGELVLVEGLDKAQRLLAEKDRNAVMSTARDKPLYESQHKAVIQRLDKLKLMPGTLKARTELTLEVQLQAQAVAGDQQYRAAFKTLNGLEGRLAAAEVASENFTKQADQQLGGLASKARQAVKDYTALCGLAQPTRVETGGKDIDAALSKMEEDPVDLLGARQALQGIEREFLEAAGLAKGEKSKYDQDFNAVTALLKTVETRAALEVYQLQLGQYREATAQYAAQQYEAAARTLATLKSSAEETIRQVTPNHTLWEQMQKDIQKDFYAPLAQAAQLQLAELKGAGSLLAQYIGARDYTAQHQHDFAQALLVGQAVKDKVGADDNSGWRKVLADLAGLQGLRDEAKLALTQAQAKLGELEKAQGDTQAYAARLQRLGVDWHSACDKTVAENAVKQALLSLKEGLTTLEGEIDGVLQDPSLLDASKKAAQGAKDEAAFKSQQASVNQLIRYLAQEYPGETAPFTLRLTGAEQDLATKPKEALQAATQLALDVQALIDEKQRAVDTVRKQAQVLGQRYLKAAEDAKSQNSSIGKAYEPLVRDIQALLGLADSTVLAVVQDGHGQLTRFQAVLDQRLLDIAKIPSKLTALAEKLKDKDLKAQWPQKLALLQARLKQEIPGRCGDSPDTALASVLVPFEKEIDDTILAASTAAATLLRINVLATAVDLEADKIADAPKLKADLKARIAAARKPGEGGELSAELELQRLQLTIEAVLAKPELAEGMEQGAQQRQFEADQARNDWEAQLELFGLREYAAAQAQHSRIAKMLGLSNKNEPLFAEMETAHADAQKFAKAQDYPRAIDQLARARRLATQYAENPEHAKIAASKNLEKAATAWRGAAAGFVREMNSLIDAVRAKCLLDPTYQPGADQVVEPLRKLAMAFDAGAFDAAVGKLNSAQDLPTRRAAKEDGLRQLRRFQELLAADPVLPMLADSPFAKVATKGLKDSARDLEVNLLRA